MNRGREMNRVLQVRDLAKSFGGTDGHKYVNGVLEKLAAQLRPQELAVARQTV